MLSNGGGITANQIGLRVSCGCLSHWEGLGAMKKAIEKAGSLAGNQDGPFLNLLQLPKYKCYELLTSSYGIHLVSFLDTTCVCRGFEI